MIYIIIYIIMIYVVDEDDDGGTVVFGIDGIGEEEVYRTGEDDITHLGG